MSNLSQDLRFGFRTLLRTRGVTSVAILALALGIGANTAIFSVVNAVLVRPLPYPQSQQLVWFWESQPGLPRSSSFSAADFLDFQSRNRSFSALAAMHRSSLNLTGHGAPERLPVMIASPNVFSLLGVQPILGRSFLPHDGDFGVPRIAILTYGFWQSHFGGDRGIIGRALTLNNEPVQIVGVLPANFRYDVGGGPANQIQVWVNPVNVVPEVFNASAGWERELRTNRSTHYLNVIGRLKPGLSITHAQSDISAIMDHLHQQFPVTAGHYVSLVPFHELFSGPVRSTLLILLGVVGVVLLISCANVANLLLARAVGRRREIAIRSALGAGRFRIVRQLLTESLLLALSGGALGLALGYALVRILVAAAPQDLPRVQEISLDSRVLLFTLGVSLLTGLLFGLAPSLAAARQSLNEFLKDGTRGSTSGVAHSRLRSLLVISEIALSLILLVGAGLLVRSFVRLLDVRPGFRPDHMITMWVNFSGARYMEKGRSTQFLEQLLPRISALPGVEAIASSNDLPLEGDDTTTGIGTAEGRPKFELGHEPLVGVHAINPGYFRAMGIPLLRGREIQASDAASSSPVAVINQKFADIIWPGEDALGKHVDIMGEKPVEVVGIVANVLHNGLAEPVSAESYLPFSQNPWAYVVLSIRTRSDPAAVYSVVRTAVGEIDPDLPVFGLRSMDDVVSETVSTRRLTLLLVGGFGILALVLSSVGIYGVMSYAVTERIHEIGVRTALGAQRSDVFRLVIGGGMRLAALGLALGIIVALFASRAMTSLLFGTRAWDPLTYIAICALLAFAAFAACYIPARRATSVDPLVALRYE